MKIVVLDGNTLNPGDLSWDALKSLGDVTIHARTPNDQILSRSKGAEVLITNKTPLMEESLAQLPDLKYIGVLATGYNVVDTEAAAKRGIVVTNVPAYSTPSVAQLAFALILEFCNRVQLHSDAVNAGEWVNSVDFCFQKTSIIELSGKTLGIIGFGAIGRKAAEIAYAFEMNVLGYDINVDNNYKHPNFKWASLDGLLKASDFVSLHCPLFPSTEGMINRETIGKMKESAYLINTSRGPLVVEADLAEALNSGRIAGAGVDVLSTEPPKPDNPLLTAKNCLITPHTAWASTAARGRLMDIAVNNLRQYQKNNPINVVN